MRILTLKNKICGLLFLVFFLSLYPFSLAEIIHLKTGKIIEGRIIEKADQYVKIDTFGGVHTPPFRAGKDYAALSINPEANLGLQPEVIRRVDFQGVELTYFMDQIDKIEGSPKGIKDKKTEEVVCYKITKNFKLKALADLYTLQFKYPLIRKDIPYQKITNLYTDPRYNALITDPDNNEIAIFYFSNVKSGNVINITISYNIQIEVPQINIDTSSAPDDYIKERIDLQKFLQNEGDLDINNDLIRKTKEFIVKDIKNPYLKGMAIYDFITKNIDYENLEHVSGVQMPSETLIIKRGNCADITKLFIALSRASGIPARQIDGVIFSPNVSEKKCIEKVGHAWVEIYLPKNGWLPVDPTFGISKREVYYCFKYNTHIKEFYGQLISRTPGSLYRGSYIEARTYNEMNRVPVDQDAQIEIEILDQQPLGFNPVKNSRRSKASFNWRSEKIMT